MGRPDVMFPWPWSIYRWIDGEPARDDRICDRNTLAADLARFLTALQAIDASDGPSAGAHSFFRGGPLVVYDAETRVAIERAADVIDVVACTKVWEQALSSTWDRPPVWVHGDVAPSNLLVDANPLHAKPLHAGVLRAVIDFGCSAVGDPACDLVMAWTFFDDESRAVFRDALALDEDTWARGRGWALWKGLITHVAGAPDGARSGRRAASRRMASQCARSRGGCPRNVIRAWLADSTHVGVNHVAST